MSQDIFAFGSNGSGQLGIGHLDDVSAPTRCLFDNEASPVDVRYLRAGGNHTLILGQDGSLWKAGSGSCHDQSQTDAESAKEDSHTVYQPVAFKGVNKPVTRFDLVSATWDASIYVTSADGLQQVYTVGNGAKGELGQGPGVECCPKPVLITDFPPSNTRIVDVAASMSHTVAVLSNGDLYGWGNGRKGQLGEPAEIVWRPRKISIPFEATNAVCGRDFTYIAASAESGQSVILGSDRWDLKKAAPSHIRGWKQIAASWCSLHVLFDNGRLFEWGRHDRGQILADGLTDVEQIAAGSEHMLAKSQDSQIVAWGWGEHGNCGQNAIEASANNISIDAKVKAVAAGCATSFIVTKKLGLEDST